MNEMIKYLEDEIKRLTDNAGLFISWNEKYWRGSLETLEHVLEKAKEIKKNEHQWKNLF